MFYPGKGDGKGQGKGKAKPEVSAHVFCCRCLVYSRVRSYFRKKARGLFDGDVGRMGWFAF